MRSTLQKRFQYALLSLVGPSSSFSIGSHIGRDTMFDGDDIFCPPSLDEKIYYDESMPPIYDDYCDDMYNKTSLVNISRIMHEMTCSSRFT